MGAPGPVGSLGRPGHPGPPGVAGRKGDIGLPGDQGEHGQQVNCKTTASGVLPRAHCWYDQLLFLFSGAEWGCRHQRV